MTVSAFLTGICSLISGVFSAVFAQPLLAFLKHPSTARASLAFYNTEAEIDRLLDSLSTLRERMGYGK